MTKTQRRILYNAKILDPETPDATAAPCDAISVCDGRIECIGNFDPSKNVFRAKPPFSGILSVASQAPMERIDLGGTYLAPGFIDLHHHGGLIFSAGQDLVKNLHASSARLVQEGTTAFLPTTVASSQARLEEILEALAPVFGNTDSARGSSSRKAHKEAHKEGTGGFAEPLGLHLEGPWINAACAGAQPKTAIRNYDATQGEAVFSRFGNWIWMVTLAPEMPGAARLLEELAKRGIVAALGHSQASAEETEAAIQLGARHVTHLFNAMKPLHHRDPGLLGVALSDDRLSCDLICDGVHLDPRIVRLAAAAKREKLVLITDRIELCGRKTENAPGDSDGFGAVHDDGTALRLQDGRLAGSSLGMDRAFRNAQSFGAMRLLEAVAACTLRPARVLGIEAERGTLRPGARADFVLLDSAGAVLQTWIAGEPVFIRDKKQS